MQLLTSGVASYAADKQSAPVNNVGDPGSVASHVTENAVGVVSQAKEKIDSVDLDELVVTANQHSTRRRLAPSLVNVVGLRTFQLSQSNSLADALPFQTGVRVEDNCESCGFKQARINGLDGHYSQILIDSRPVFSALSSVYGLEIVPENLIARTEVMRGGGSALYGSSAVGGTINLITRDPISNSAEIKHSLMSIGGTNAFDNNTEVSGSATTSSHQAGIYVFGQNRYRKGYDRNGDGITELPQLKSQTFGTKAFVSPNENQRISLNFFHAESTHRGGSDLDLQPSQASVSEMAQHNITQAGIEYKLYSPDEKQHFDIYTSFMNTDRDSYSGGKDAVGDADPSLFYTRTTDLLSASGVRYCYMFDKLLFMPSSLTVGADYSYDHLVDRFLGFNSEDTQTMRIASVLAQNEWRNDQWSILLGLRIDKHNLISHAIASPRVNIRFSPTRDVNLRIGYGAGFRAPQTFDEDLHVDMAGGERFRVHNASNLKEERSHSFNLSGDFCHTWERVKADVTIEGFYTKLNNSFAIRTTDATDADGCIIRERYNGDGAYVAGFNVEGKLQYANLIEMNAGFTLQCSRYTSPQQWSDDESVPAEKKMFRSPDAYGFLTLSVTPTRNLTLSTTGTYTGSMLVAHVAGSGVSQDVAVNTPSFFDANIRIAYGFTLVKGVHAEASAGIQNVFDSCQKDFDSGVNRDSDYIYGPSLPRSYFGSFSIQL